MKKEDFVIGKWYCSSQFLTTIAFKFNGFAEMGHLQPSEKITTYGSYSIDNVARYVKKYESYREVSLSEIQQYLPKGHKDLFNNELQSFPETGYCTTIDEDLINYLKTERVRAQGGEVDNFDCIVWTKNYVWRGTLNYAKNNKLKEYTIQELQKFINVNITKNENNELQTITSEDRQSVRRGAIAVRCGGQQVTTRVRPTGNSTRVNITETTIRSSKIIKSIIKRENT